MLKFAFKNVLVHSHPVTVCIKIENKMYFASYTKRVIKLYEKHSCTKRKLWGSFEVFVVHLQVKFKKQENVSYVGIWLVS